MYAGEDIITQTYSSNLVRQHWDLITVTESLNGVILYDLDTGVVASAALTRYVAVEKNKIPFSLSLKAVAYSSTSIEQNFYWTSSNPEIATVDSSTGKVTGVAPGAATITVHKANANGTGGIGTTDTYTVVVPELVDGMYFIINRQHRKYLQSDDLTAPDYSTNGAIIEQWEFGRGEHQCWNLEVQYNGYYLIQSVLGARYLTVPSGYETIEDVTLIQKNIEASDRQRWKISLTSNGSYKIKAKSSEGHTSDLVMVAGNIVNGSDNGIVVQQRKYVSNDSYKDEWYICKNIDVALVALPEEYDRSSNFNIIANNLSNAGYSISYNNHSIIQEGVTKEQLLFILSHSKITLIRTHGSRVSIEVTDGDLTRTDMKKDMLADVELVVYGACLTGSGGNNGVNLVNSTVDAGARTVIGFENRVNASLCNSWCSSFFNYYSQYYNDSTKNFESICVEVDDQFSDDKNYEYYNDEGKFVSLRNYVVAGERSFPD
jgi:hypothetical protein